MNLERLIQAFLQRHVDADEIVWDTERDLPHKAVYRRLKSGALRTHVVEYRFDDWFFPDSYTA